MSQWSRFKAWFATSDVPKPSPGPRVFKRCYHRIKYVKNGTWRCPRCRETGTL